MDACMRACVRETNETRGNGDILVHLGFFFSVE